MTNPTVEKITKSNAEALATGGQTAERMMKAGTEALTESGNASRAALQELTKAYQELATRNAKTLTAAIQELSTAKNPVEFIELQQKQIKEGVSAVLTDSQHIAQLAAAVITAAFDPAKKLVEAAPKAAQA